jgi:hypothetical protein
MNQLPTAPASTDSLHQSQIHPHIHFRGVLPTVTQVPVTPISMPWRYAGSDASGRRLTIVFAEGDGGYCVKPQGVIVRESPESVLVTVVSEVRSDGVCPASLSVAYGYVELMSPLGSRALLHPPTDPHWPASLLN